MRSATVCLASETHVVLHVLLRGAPFSFSLSTSWHFSYNPHVSQGSLVRATKKKSVAKAWISIALCVWHPGNQMIWFSLENSILKCLAYVVYSLPSSTNGSSFVLSTCLPLPCGSFHLTLKCAERLILTELKTFSDLVPDIRCGPSPKLAASPVRVSALHHLPRELSTACSARAWGVRRVFCLVVFISHLFLFLFELVPRALLCHVGLAWSSPIWSKNIPSEARLSILLHCQKRPSKQSNKSNKQHFPEALPQSRC